MKMRRPLSFLYIVNEMTNLSALSSELLALFFCHPFRVDMTESLRDGGAMTFGLTVIFKYYFM